MHSPIQAPSALRQQILQLAQTLADNLELTAQQAPLGTVLDACEGLLLDQGRQFLRDCLATTLQQQADLAQKKGVASVPVLAATLAETRATTPASS